MNHELPDFVPLAQSPRELDSLIIALQGYWKTQSIVILKRVGLPTLDGVVVFRPEGMSDAVKFFEKNGVGEVLLRHDRKPEFPSSPMGGYIVNLSALRSEAQKFFEARRILILLEPYSAFDDSYSVTSLCKADSMVVLEVVGPGFDASDLQRGHITPHEVLEFDLKMFPPTGTFRIDAAEHRKRLVVETRYRVDVGRRYLKIFRRLVEHGLIANQETVTDVTSIAKAKDYLMRAGYDMLLTHEDSYRPIPEENLVEILQYIMILSKAVRGFVDRSPPFSVSASFLGKEERLAFWDIVWPELKYDLTQRPMRQG